MSNSQIVLQLFIQVALILLICQIAGFIMKKIGQPQVVGEMIAGIVLGPSLLGLLWPQLQSQIFPKAANSGLYILSQVGVVLYMFLVGIEIDKVSLRQNIRSAVAISLSGIFAPLVLGAGLAFFLFNDSRLFTPGTSTWSGMLFMGAAMSITALPVLARIIQERNLLGTRLGNLSLTSGAVSDVVAWCILAFTLANVTGQISVALFAIGGAAIYTVVVWFGGRPALNWLSKRAEEKNGLTRWEFTLVLIALMLGAWFTDAAGIHAVFGAFILGLAMPRGKLTEQLRHYIEPLTLNFLLPLFFIYSGLNTQLSLVNSGYLWLLTGIVLVVAFAGKAIACWLAALASGMNQRESLAIGTLMNTRGLVELVILNIGLEKGIITPTLFTIMVIMALVTTFMTTPLFKLIYPRHSQGFLGNVIEQPASGVQPGKSV